MKQRENLDRIAAAGASAFYAGKLYSENPHLPGSAARLAWGEGHNGARAGHLLRVGEHPWMDVIPKSVDGSSISA